jgi:glycerol-3-phosphate dehydrogenase
MSHAAELVSPHPDVISVDVAVVGGGVMGIALARHLMLMSQSCAPQSPSTPPSLQIPPPPRVALIEALPTALRGASSGNSAMIHCGFDCTTGTTEHEMVVRGHALFTAFASSCKQRNVYLPWVPSGALMLAMNSSEMHTLESEILTKAEENGVHDVKLLSREAVLSLEPHVHPDVVGALHIPREWIVDPWWYPALLLAEGFSTGRLSMVPSFRVTYVDKVGVPSGELYRLWDKGKKRCVEAHIVVNCAGLKGDALESLCPLPSSKSRLVFTLFPRLGRFQQYAAGAMPLVQHALLPIPTKKSKGIILFRTVYGQVIIGPTAEDPDEPRMPQASVMKILRAAAVSKVPALQDVEGSGAYAGARPALRGRSDYFLDRDSRGIGWFTIAGVRSTGLTASLAVAELFSADILRLLGATTKTLADVSRDAVRSALCALIRDGVLSLDHRHPISLDGNIRPKL